MRNTDKMTANKLFEYARTRYEEVVWEGTHSRETGAELTTTPELMAWIVREATKEKERIEVLARAKQAEEMEARK